MSPWTKVHMDFDHNMGPNSTLLTNNNFFDMVRNNETIHLIHVTRNKQKIIDTKTIFPSGGCLVGSVYCTPGIVESKSDWIKLHNLGSYYYLVEARNNRSLDNLVKPDTNVDILIISIENNITKPHNIAGINYLKLGQLHFDIYTELDYLLTGTEAQTLKHVILDKLNSAKEFIEEVSNLITGNEIPSNHEIFFELFHRNIEAIPILGYIYFEAFAKTLMLHQTDAISARHVQLGEFYNWHYKEILFELFPNYLSNFNLGKFTPSFADVLNIVQKKNLISSVELFKKDFYSQLFRLLMEVFDFPNSSGVNVKNEMLSIPKELQPLVGHIIHRILRNFDRYPDFYFYFDQVKALHLWNYWNKRKVIIPFNGVIPKGEVGINPAYLANLNYKVHEAGEIDVNGQNVKVKLGKELDVRIIPRLVDTGHSFMRNKRHY